MAETHTVDPDGGKDYTVLQTAENAQDGDLAGRGVVAFECYNSTTELGPCTITGWSNADSSNYVRVFTPLAERHDGTFGSGGAWIHSTGNVTGVTVGVDYVRVEGFRISYDNTGGVYGISIPHYHDAVVLDSNLIVTAAAHSTLSKGILHIAIEEPGRTCTIKNNIIYGAGKMHMGISSGGFEEKGNTTSLTSTIQNNTIDNCIGAGITVYESEEKAEVTHNVTLENNICTNNGTDFSASVARGTVTGNNNCSEDATANNWDGSGSIINQTPGDLFATEGSDHNLKAGSNALAAGKTIAGFDNDALHLESDNWRPQNSVWDMGALELETLSGGGGLGEGSGLDLSLALNL